MVLGVVDAADSPAPENPADDSSVSSQIRKLVGMVDLSKQKLVLLMNKCDKISENSDAASGSSDANVRAAGEGLLEGHFCNESGGIGPDNKNVIKINNFVKSLVSENNTPEVLWISAKRGFGLDKLRELLTSMVGKASADGVLVTNARHAAALRDAAASLRTVQAGLASSLPSDLLAEDLREALRSLGSITGEISTDEVLGEIFAKFCIGK